MASSKPSVEKKPTVEPAYLEVAYYSLALNILRVSLGKTDAGECSTPSLLRSAQAQSAYYAIANAIVRIIYQERMIAHSLSVDILYMAPTNVLYFP